MKCVGLAVFLASTFVAASASAAVRYAEPGGNGTPTMCVPSDPCNIQDAVENASVNDGDDVVLLPGIYALVDDPVFVDNAIDLHGAAGTPRPTITGAACFAPITVTDTFPGGALVRDLEIQHTSGGCGTGLFIRNASTGERLVVESDTVFSACALEGDALLRDSSCRGPDGAGAGVDPAAGAIEQARLLNVTAFGAFGLFARGKSGGTATLNAKNVIAEGTNRDALAQADYPGDTATIVLEYSNYDTQREIFDGDASVTDPGTGTNQTAAPLLVDPASGDFHQLPGSPTIDAGAGDPQLGALDVDGEPRIQGAGPDIGADEFVSPQPTPPPVSKPSNAFTLGAITRNKKKGTATITVNVPNPGELTGSGKGVKVASAAVTSKTVTAPGEVKLTIKAKGKKKRTLNETGKVKVKPKITYTPTGGDPSTRSLKVKLKKKL